MRGILLDSISSRLVDESLGKVGDYPFRDVEGRGISWRQGSCTCVSFSQLQSSLDFHLAKTIQLSAIGPIDEEIIEQYWKKIFHDSKWPLSQGRTGPIISIFPIANAQTASSHFCRSYLRSLVLVLSRTTVQLGPPCGLGRQRSL
jgi:hypothetical protein